MEHNYAYLVNPNPNTKLPDIEGLAELKSAFSAWPTYLQARKNFEEGIIYDLPMKPQVNVQALEKQYPRAAAYLRAETWQKSASFVKSRLGKLACEKIIAGEDYVKALEEMEHGYAAFTVAQEG